MQPFLAFHWALTRPNASCRHPVNVDGNLFLADFQKFLKVSYPSQIPSLRLRIFGGSIRTWVGNATSRSPPVFKSLIQRISQSYSLNSTT